MPLVTSADQRDLNLMKSAGGRAASNMRVSNALDQSKMVNNHDSTALLDSQIVFPRQP